MSESVSANSPIMLGLFQQMPLPAVSRYLAQQGWKWIILDMQHGPMNYETAYECIHTLRALGAKPYVRVSVDLPSEIQKILDLCGAAGIVVPVVNTKEQAQAAAYAAKVPAARRPFQGWRSRLPLW